MSSKHVVNLRDQTIFVRWNFRIKMHKYCNWKIIRNRAYNYQISDWETDTFTHDYEPTFKHFHVYSNFFVIFFKRINLMYFSWIIYYARWKLHRKSNYSNLHQRLQPFFDSSWSILLNPVVDEKLFYLIIFVISQFPMNTLSLENWNMIFDVSTIRLSQIGWNANLR